MDYTPKVLKLTKPKKLSPPKQKKFKYPKYFKKVRRTLKSDLGR